MAPRTDSFDLAAMQLRPGEGRRLDLATALEALRLGQDTYTIEPDSVPVTLDVSRMAGGGYSLRLRLRATIAGPCMRCLDPAAPELEVDAREVDAPGGVDELTSPYVTDEVLDLAAWAHDAFALALPAQVLCRPDCVGLCPICGTNLNEAGPEHAHEPEPDPRWAALRELKFD